MQNYCPRPILFRGFSFRIFFKFHVVVTCCLVRANLSKTLFTIVFLLCFFSADPPAVKIGKNHCVVVQTRGSTKNYFSCSRAVPGALFGPSGGSVRPPDASSASSWPTLGGKVSSKVVKISCCFFIEFLGAPIGGPQICKMLKLSILGPIVFSLLSSPLSRIPVIVVV